MRTFVAGVSKENQNLFAYDSFVRLRTREGDVKTKIVGQRGDQARIELLDMFLRGDWEAILLLDLDMVHPPDLLDRLKAHNVSMVSGHYYKRGFPMRSIAGTGQFPYMPVNFDSQEDSFFQVQTSGFGNALIKREVIVDVKKTLEPNDSPFAIGTCPEIIDDGSHFGSDTRFFAKATALGWPLYLDTTVESKHATTIYLDSDLYEKLRDNDWEEKEKARIEEKRAILGH